MNPRHAHSSALISLLYIAGWVLALAVVIVSGGAK